MPNNLGPTGLTTATQAELVAQYTAALQAIFGADINLGPSTPDGQLVMLFIQSVLDLQDLLIQIYNTFDPDNAIGVVLDQRVAINGIQRQAGTFTITPVTLTISQSVNLFGLDQSVQPVYTVADNAGNQWQLQSTVTGLGTGSQVLTFQSATPGAITTVPNTITVPVTIILGVDAINNPTAYTTLGVNEESDAALKVRRQISVSLPSQGYLAGLIAALENISGVTYAFVEENNTGSTNADGVPAHSIWVIVSGSGAAADIANAIYTKRNAGCGMYASGFSGAQSYTITQVDGSPFTVYWDDVITVPLFVKFTATSLNKTTPPNIAAIRAGLVNSFLAGPGAQVNINDLATQVQAIDPNSLITSSGFSLTSGGSYTTTLTPTTKNKQFEVSSADTIILSMILAAPPGVLGIGYNINSSTGVVTNTTLSIVHGTTFTFLGLGGYGVYTYSISTSTGGTIDSSTGVYVAGTAGTDTITVTDSLSNTATCTVTVT